jgi:hypothetical protein
MLNNFRIITTPAPGKVRCRIMARKINGAAVQTAPF